MCPAVPRRGAGSRDCRSSICKVRAGARNTAAAGRERCTRESRGVEVWADTIDAPLPAASAMAERPQQLTNAHVLKMNGLSIPARAAPIPIVVLNIKYDLVIFIQTDHSRVRTVIGQCVIY
jgi:hypothetical protein